MHPRVHLVEFLHRFPERLRVSQIIELALPSMEGPLAQRPSWLFVPSEQLQN